MRRRPTAARALLLALGLASCHGKQAPPPPPPPPVDVAVAGTRDVPDELRTIGTVIPIQTVGIKSRVDGQLLQIAFKEGQMVEEGQLLFQLDPRPFENAVAAAKANLQRDKAQASFARAEARRFLGLARQGAASVQVAQSRLSASASAAAAVRADEAMLQNAELSLSYTSIRAPFSGRTGQLNFHVGDQVPANSTVPLISLVQISPIDVRFSVPSDRLTGIRAAEAGGRLRVRASPRGAPEQVHEGVLTFIDNQADPTTGTVQLKGRFPNEDQALWPGLFVEIALEVGVFEQAVVAPGSAVEMGQQGPYVFVVGANDEVEQRQVQLGPRSGDSTVIFRGLSAGETVVTDGQLRLRPGTKVQVRAPGAGPAPGGSGGPPAGPAPRGGAGTGSTAPNGGPGPGSTAPRGGAGTGSPAPRGGGPSP